MEELVFQNSRQQDILQLLAVENVLTVKEIAARLGVSLVTVRRDLEILQKYNKIKKYHGGVIFNKADTPQALFDLSLENNSSEKHAIAKVASTLISEDSIIGVDASSTAYCIADYLSQAFALKVITYSLFNAIKFSSNLHLSVFQLGGNVHGVSGSVNDFFAVESCKNFNADITFFSNHAFHPDYGGFDSSTTISVKNALIGIAKQAVLLVDSSKFNKTAMCLSVPIAQIDTIITDENIPEESVAIIRERGTELYIAKIEDGSILAHYNPVSE